MQFEALEVVPVSNFANPFIYIKFTPLG